MTTNEWKILSHEGIRKFLAPAIKGGLNEADVVQLSKDIVQPEVSPVSPEEPQPLSSLVSAAAKPPEHLPPLPDKSLTGHELHSLVNRAEGAKIEVLELAHMIDTGGQPELMEVMPCLIHNANLAIMVVNLVYGLDDHPILTFHEKGVWYQRSISSRYTCKDIILKLASTLHAKKSGRTSSSTFHLLVVATHPDCVGHNLHAQIERLNRELKRLLLPAFEDELIVYEADRIAFVVNLKTPSRADEEVLGLIRSKMSEPSLGNTIEVPSSFFMFEQELLEYAKSIAKRDILSLGEYRQVGARLEMSDEVVEAALVLFHRQNTFLYFRHVLPNHVFVNPQIPLDIVNGIISFSYKLSAGELKGFPNHFSTQIKQGIITEEMLSYNVSSHFLKGIMSLKMLSSSFATP